MGKAEEEEIQRAKEYWDNKKREDIIRSMITNHTWPEDHKWALIKGIYTRDDGHWDKKPRQKRIRSIVESPHLSDAQKEDFIKTYNERFESRIWKWPRVLWVIATLVSAIISLVVAFKYSYFEEGHINIEPQFWFIWITITLSLFLFYVWRLRD